jgi:hypothetical protein
MFSQPKPGTRRWKVGFSSTVILRMDTSGEFLLLQANHFVYLKQSNLSVADIDCSKSFWKVLGLFFTVEYFMNNRNNLNNDTALWKTKTCFWANKWQHNILTKIHRQTYLVSPTSFSAWIDWKSSAGAAGGTIYLSSLLVCNDIIWASYTGLLYSILLIDFFVKTTCRDGSGQTD